MDIWKPTVKNTLSKCTWSWRSIVENLFKLHHVCIMPLWEWIERKKCCYNWVRRHDLGIKDKTFYGTIDTRVWNCLGFIHPNLEDRVNCLEVQAAQKAIVEEKRPLCPRWFALPCRGEGQCRWGGETVCWSMKTIIFEFSGLKLKNSTEKLFYLNLLMWLLLKLCGGQDNYGLILERSYLFLSLQKHGPSCTDVAVLTSCLCSVVLKVACFTLFLLKLVFAHSLVLFVFVLLVWCFLFVCF